MKINRGRYEVWVSPDAREDSTQKFISSHRTISAARKSLDRAEIKESQSLTYLGIYDRTCSRWLLEEEYSK